MNQSEFKVITCNGRQARENAPVQLVIGFGFASHWLRKCREFCQPITEQSKAKPKETITFETQLKTAVYTSQCSTHLLEGWIGHNESIQKEGIAGGRVTIGSQNLQNQCKVTQRGSTQPSNWWGFI